MLLGAVERAAVADMVYTVRCLIFVMVTRSQRGSESRMSLANWQRFLSARNHPSA